MYLLWTICSFLLDLCSFQHAVIKGYDYDLELELQIQVGSKMFPDDPVSSLAQAVYELKNKANTDWV